MVDGGGENGNFNGVALVSRCRGEAILIVNAYGGRILGFFCASGLLEI